METTVQEKLYKVSATSKIVTGWKSYANCNGLKPNTQKYWKAMHAFVNGCSVLSGEQGLPPIIQIYIMSGRDIAEIKSPS
jgi:hypothetical protein